jgi:hypothetical protein
LSDSRKRQQVIFRKPKYPWFLWFEVYSIPNCFWNLFITSGLFQIGIVGNGRKLPSPLTRNILIPCSEKISWSLKTSFCKKKCPIISIISKLLSYPWDSKIYKEAIFEFIWHFFFQNDVFNSKKSFQSLGSEYSLKTDLEVTWHFLSYRFEKNQRSLKDSKSSLKK